MQEKSMLYLTFIVSDAVSVGLVLSPFHTIVGGVGDNMICASHQQFVFPVRRVYTSIVLYFADVMNSQRFDSLARWTWCATLHHCSVL
jgi:hypothetical protein